MDLDKTYQDIDGSECNILELVKRNPEWAANIIQRYEKLERENTVPTCERCGFLDKK